MKIIHDKNDLINFIHTEKNLGFVPTMGALHKGHISLIKKSLTQCNKTLVSIYINKPQFNKKSDFAKYPRTLKKDITILNKVKVDYLYLPRTEQIYPNGTNANIKISSLGKKLCGKYRPGHFESVVDIVDRFMNIIKPRKIFFGEKDMQQLKIIEDFARKKHGKIKIIGCKTIREKSGIAYSSRNLLLTIKEKNIASNIYKYLLSRKSFIVKKKIKITLIKKNIYKFGATHIDYIEVLNINKLTKHFQKKNKYKIFIAYYLGSIRLIDNI